MKGAEAGLLGSWRRDPSDAWSLREFGDVSLRFESDGSLLYTIRLPNKEQTMRLTYTVADGWLTTNQPSAPREHRVEFFFTSDGRLGLKNPPPAPTTFYVRV